MRRGQFEAEIEYFESLRADGFVDHAKQGLFVALEFGNAGAGKILIDSFSLTPNEHILVDSKLNLLKDPTHLETLWFELRELGNAVALMRPRKSGSPRGCHLIDLAAERLRDGEMEVATSLLLSLSKQGDRRASYKLAYQYECMGRIGAAREFFRLAFDQGLQYSIFDLAALIFCLVTPIWQFLA